MVVKLFLIVLGGAIGGLLDILPSFDVPDWISSVSDALATVVRYLSGASGWVPWTVLGLGVGLFLACIAVTVGIRVVRIVASFATAGGGGA